MARALGSYPGCRWFKSDCRYHFHGPLVKRLRHRPFTAESWVRFPYGSPIMYLANAYYGVCEIFFYHENVLCPLFGLFSGYIVLTGAILSKKTERTVYCCFWRKNNRPVFRAVTYLILCLSIAVFAVIGIFCSILVRQVIFDPLCHHKR